VSGELNISTERVGDRATVICAGEIDEATAHQLSRALGHAMEPDVNALRVDMSGVRFLDSTGLRSLVVAATQCEGLGIDFSLATSPWVDRLLEVAGMRDLVHGRRPPSPADW
jgi:anti-sigma B factor antagonist